MNDEKSVLLKEIEILREEYEMLSKELIHLETKLKPLSPYEEPTRIISSPESIARKKYIKNRLPKILSDIDERKERIRLIELGI